jgi:hypothetical protein
MPQEDRKEIKQCRKCDIELNDNNKVTKQNLCRPCSSRLCKEYKQNNKKLISDYNKVYKSEHKDEIKVYNHDYNLENREAIQKRQTEQHRRRRETDVNFKLAHSCRNRIRNLLIKDNITKGSLKTFNLLGCDVNFLKEWLQYNFKEGMTLDNYGQYWHIDHVIPCSLFNLQDKNELKICCHWTNLQPMEAKANLSKNNSLNMEEVRNHIQLIKIYETNKQINVNRHVKKLTNYLIKFYDTILV